MAPPGGSCAIPYGAGPVTNAESAAFVEAGGYQRRERWRAQGWVWRMKAQAQHPRYWQRAGQGWLRQHFETLVPLEPYASMVHVTWYEAEAYCHGAGRRLPTEAEWDMVASAEPTPARANLDTRVLGWAAGAAFPA